MKYFNILFPLLDHLYIYQILEYEPISYLKWFLKNPFKRNLQRKQKLTLTSKALSLILLSTLFMLLTAVYLNLVFLRGVDWPVILILFFYFQLFSPVFILAAQLILLPLENYSKHQLMEKAQRKLSKLFSLKIVAITGSYAKTSTKNMLYTLLWKKYRVVKTPKSYNNPLSIAQTIIEDVKDNTQVFIVEVGAYRMGDIAKVTSWLKPEIGIITGIAPQHLERFGSLENIAKAKFELVEGLAENGIAILNGENSLLGKQARKNKHKTVFFGNEKDKIYATDIKITPEGTSFVLHLAPHSSPITIPLIGTHHVQNFLAAAAAASEFNLSMEDIKTRAVKLLPTPHRLEIKKEGNVTTIDNSYNTNPESAKTSFKLLKEYPGKQKIIITPGLIELGWEKSIRNKEFAKVAAKSADEIIIVGESNKKDLLAGLKDAKFHTKTHTAKDLSHAMKILGKISKENAVVLIENDLPDQYF